MTTLFGTFKDNMRDCSFILLLTAAVKAMLCPVAQSKSKWIRVLSLCVCISAARVAK